MNSMPVIIAYEKWINSQFSLARHLGSITINGREYILVSDGETRETPDLLRADWLPIYKRLGRRRTIGLIKNGTTVDAALSIIKTMDSIVL